MKLDLSWFLIGLILDLLKNNFFYYKSNNVFPVKLIKFRTLFHSRVESSIIE